MNVIIANQHKDELESLNIDVIKKMDGTFSVDTIIDTFTNFYFNRMIIDITALEDYLNITTIQKLSASLDASKIILLLTDDPRVNNSYLSKIISLGIYNFTKDITGIVYLMDNPNSYRDVAQYHDLALSDERSIQESKNPSPFSQNRHYIGGNSDYNESSYMNPDNDYSHNNTLILGFKDLTDDAGATTLIYMLKKELSKKRSVLAIEINGNDFSYFDDNELMSVSSNNIGSVRAKFGQFDVVLIDINNSNLDTDGTCNEVIYLLEPSTIKLNTLMRKDRNALAKLDGKKIVLNKSLLTQMDVKEFEYEAKVKMFYNIPPLDERKASQMVLDSFLDKLGVNSASGANQSSGGGLFGFLKK